MNMTVFWDVAPFSLVGRSLPTFQRWLLPPSIRVQSKALIITDFPFYHVSRHVFLCPFISFLSL
jgi:hypothetical protein